MGPQTLSEPVDYVVVGHVCVDEAIDGTRLGGTAAYAARAAERLGQRVGIVTSAAANLDLSGSLPGVALRRVPAPASTRFRNIYAGGARRQVLVARAADLTLDNVPLAWRAAPILHIAPIAREIDRGLVGALRPAGRFIGVTPQGWLRGWDAHGSVAPLPCGDLAEWLRPADALVVSDEDLAADAWGDLAAAFLGARALLSAVPAVALTRGAEGVLVYSQARGSRPVPVAACPAQVCDPTGAGDVFAATWFVRLAAGEDTVAAARYAACAAACAIEHPGLAGVASAAEIEERLAQWVA